MKIMTMLWNMGIKLLTHAKTKGKPQDLQYINPCLVEDTVTEVGARALGGN